MIAPPTSRARLARAAVTAPLALILLMAVGIAGGTPAVRAVPSVVPAVELRFESPADETRTSDRRPLIIGSGALPASEVTVTVRDQTLIARADADGRWQVAPTPLAVGPVSIRASTDVAGETVMAAPDPLGITITPPLVRIDAPLDGTSTRQRRPLIGGSGVEPGAEILVDLDDEQLIADVGEDGRWSVPLAADLVLGPHELRARQVMWEVTSDTVTSRFAVVGSTPSPTSTPTTPTPSTSLPAARPTVAAPATPSHVRTHRPTVRRPPASTGSRSAPGTTAERPPTTRLSYGPSGGDTAEGARNAPDNNAPDTNASGTTGPDTESSTPRTGRHTPEAATGSADHGADDYLPLRFSLADATLTPGRVSTLVGTIGPGRAERPVTATLSGRLTRGLAYRSVSIEPVGSCVVAALHFSCTLTLRPHQRATVRLRLIPDAESPPDFARQQLQVQAGSGPVNALTRTVRVDHRPTEVAELASSISNGPGPVVTLFALYLLALAAAEWEHRHRRPSSSRSTRPPSPTAPPRRKT